MAAFLSLGSVTTQVSAEIYKYVDETGRITYGKTPKVGSSRLDGGKQEIMDEESVRIENERIIERQRIADERELKRKREADERAKKPGVKIGMSPIQVIGQTNWGKPNSINQTITASLVSEQWVYSTGFLYFTNGKLTTIQMTK